MILRKLKSYLRQAAVLSDFILACSGSGTTQDKQTNQITSWGEFVESVKIIWALGQWGAFGTLVSFGDIGELW
jgi:hypothetical protein